MIKDTQPCPPPAPSPVRQAELNRIISGLVAKHAMARHRRITSGPHEIRVGGFYVDIGDVHGYQYVCTSKGSYGAVFVALGTTVTRRLVIPPLACEGFKEVYPPGEDPTEEAERILASWEER